jgi:hypothetical protein
MVSFMPKSLYLRGKAPGTHWTGGWVGSSVSLDNVERKKILPLLGLYNVYAKKFSLW